MPRLLRFAVQGAAALASLLALPAIAQTPCPGVCIGFAAAGGVAGVPLSTEAMALLSLFVAGAGYVALRRRSGLMALLFATALAGAAMSTDIRQAIAASLYQVVLGAGNMAAVTLPANYVGPVDVQNSSGSAVTITSLTVGPGFALDPATTLHAGSVVPAGGTLTGPVVITAAAPSCTESGTLHSINDDGGATPFRVVNNLMCTDVLGRTINFAIDILSQQGGAVPFTGPASLSVDTNGVVRLDPINANGPWTIQYRWSATAAGTLNSTSGIDTLEVVDNF